MDLLKIAEYYYTDTKALHHPAIHDVHPNQSKDEIKLCFCLLLVPAIRKSQYTIEKVIDAA